ncbi:MAG TPA: AMP-binding protein, partial [Burkholderiaceae bacterium]
MHETSAALAADAQSLDRVLDWRARETPDAPFLAFQGRPPLTFAATREAALDLAFALERAGIGPGDRVVTLGRNSVDGVLLWFAIELLGAIDCPVNPAFTGQPLRHAIRLVEAGTVIAEPELLARLDALEGDLPALVQCLVYPAPDAVPPQVADKPATALRCDGERPADWHPAGARPWDLCSILFTSGTTGPSKGAMVTHAQAFATARQTVAGLKLTGADKLYCAHPLFHMSPRFCGIYAAMLTGMQVNYDTSFSAAGWIDRIRATRSTVTIGHGPLLEMIHAEPERPDDADTALTRIGTSPFPRHIAGDFERRFGVKGIETWGMTEVNIPCWHPYDEPLRAGSCGKVLDADYEFQVVDPNTDAPLPAGSVGEFVVRPKRPWLLSPGYYGDPAATWRAWRNLWFHTGDSGYVDADGWVYFVDRLGDRIRRRAENISSFDIEVVARSHPAVLECAAVGVPSEYASDDDVKLCVVWREGCAVEPIVLLAFLAQQLPHHMVPRYLETLDALPRTPTQKVRKAVLRENAVTAQTWDRKAAGVSLRDLAAAGDAAPV